MGGDAILRREFLFDMANLMNAISLGQGTWGHPSAKDPEGG
jgi:hypothetical protein